MPADAPFLDSAVPLAARMRPVSLDEVVGQQKLLKPGSPLWELAKPTVPGQGAAGTSVILFGPPGTGKTTLAQVIAKTSGRQFVELSAVTAGVKDVREVMTTARQNLESFGSATLLFLDEAHRFSKAQQDALLPGVEAGWVTLIAATTENPSFSVIAPLLSRSLLCVLEPLSPDDVLTLLERALKERRGLNGAFKANQDVLKAIAARSGGDGRRALTLLEAAARFAASTAKSGKPGITIGALDSAMQDSISRYDRDGDQHYDIISAFIKSVRGSDPDAAVHWLARMLDGGEDPRFIARRLIILAAEDVGLADPQALPLAVAAAEAVALIGMPEGRIPLSEVTIYLALAPKSNSAYNAINSAISDVKAGLAPRVPKHLRSSNYPGSERLGNGLGYVYPHDDKRAVTEQEYFSEEDQAREYYLPKTIGFERELAERWQKLKSIVRGRKGNS